MSTSQGEPYRACATCTAGYPDLADEVCDGHTESVQTLARLLAEMTHGPDPLPQNVCAFLDDGEQIVGWLGDLGEWHIVRTGTLDLDPLWSVNGVPFRLDYGVDDHPTAVPVPPQGECPECDEDVGVALLDWTDSDRTAVEVECLGCGELRPLRVWWPSAKDRSVSPGGAS